MDIIHSYVQQPLSKEDLIRMLGRHSSTNVFLDYDNLAGKTLSSIFSGNITSAIIFETIRGGNSSGIGHWVCILNHPDHYEHFDSYGLGIEEEVKITNENQGILTNLLKSSNKPLAESGRKLQERKEDVNTCGRWVVARVHLAKYELPVFYRFIDMVHQIPDVAVTLLTMFTV